MKRLYLMAVCSFILKIAASQPISPAPTTEFCPNTEITFTATITKPYQSMTGIGSCVVTQLPTSPVGTTFTFKGKFGDVNQKQTFQVTHPDGSHTDFDFKKIKSLFYATTCTPIQPNLTKITAPRCVVTNFPITFSNVPWSTNFESPSLCFGAVTQYEYQLPANWKIGTFTSTGSNWYAGGNSVTVTSDLSTGDGGFVNIRPANTACGAGLVAGQTISISVSRPAPAMSITPGGNQAYICSGSKTFTLNGLPTGASVTSWVSSDPSQATVPSGSTGSSVVVTKVVGDGSIKLTANVSQCSYTYQVPLTIVLGTYIPAVYNISSNSIVSNGNLYQYYTNPPPPYFQGSAYLHANEQVHFYSIFDNAAASVTNPVWSVSGTYSFFSSSTNTFTLYMQAPASGLYSRNNATVKLTANGTCGPVNTSYTLQAILSSTSFRINASPNPANGNINVSITKVSDTKDLSKQQFQPLAESTKSAGKTRIYLYNFNTNALVKEWSYSETNVMNYNLSIVGVKPGWYILKMDRDNTTTTTKILIK